ncbi:DNA repair endonuclease XPF (DNA excision repair protein ERCC-4) [Durusdinium trenchii]|uniref:DNA repair endonuclease XPF (DNA excision repair protein ERCC-4) n=1 Tax=Durusdinium trenchii TaxID=1381693 RepID=A0ABP0IW09_9DINO
MMLSYHHGAVEGLLRSQACLAVLGQGLGIQKVVLEAFRKALAGCADKQAPPLIFLLNTSQEEAELLAKRASEDPLWAGLVSSLSVIGADFGTKDRAAAFACGGGFIANARLLVPDILSGRLNPESIDGVFVNHAHQVAELSADAFVLRLFRLRNTRGFIRAISDMPDSFTRSHVQLEKVMQRCFLNDLEVWPRIRKEVQNSLKQESQPEVVQITLELPKQMLELQRHILNIVQSTLAELKKDPNLELGLSTLDAKDSVSAAFEVELRQVLDPAWQNLGPSARRLVNDLNRVRRLLTELLRGDAVDFLRLLDTLCGKEAQTAPVWLHSPDAQAMLAFAKGRVYEICRSQHDSTPFLRKKLEPHAKWSKILDAIDRTISKVAAAEKLFEKTAASGVGDENNFPHSDMETLIDESDSDVEIVGVKTVKNKKRRTVPPSASEVLEPRILIIAPDDRSRRQLSTFLHRGAEATLLDNLGSYFRDRAPRLRQESGLSIVREGALMAQEADAAAQELEKIRPDGGALRLRELPDGRPCHPRIDVVTEDAEGQLEVHMEEMQPHAVVVFEPSLHAIRAVEVYYATLHWRASACVKLEPEASQEEVPLLGGDISPLHVYLLAFDDSIENHRYQQSLVSESQGIDSIIKFRQHMTWRVDLPVEATPAESSRRGGGARALQAMAKPRVVVDMREFRSTLPFMLHLRGLVVEPVTIPVGDYILSRDICVERKAIVDLVQSLSSGRLYQQAQNMCRHYGNPMLLVEFDPAKGFILQSSYAIARREIEVGTKDLLGKLSLLVLHFPKLRIMWSPSPRFTADFFMKLKEGRYQPDSKAAAQIDAEDLEEDTEGAHKTQSNSAAFEVLRKLPGITPKNMHVLARRAGNLAGLLDLSLGELGEIMGDANANQLHSFLRASSQTAATQDRGLEDVGAAGGTQEQYLSADLPEDQ